ncbi:glycosyltransferase [Candidatus Babeliales bacterium]|nr:glycosyltransferase [Candidatus Babeliales bacterium]
MNKIKKILIVGFFSKNPKIYTYATSFYNICLELNYIVEKFDYRQKYFKYSKINNYLNNIFLLKKIKKFKPDLIFFIKSETIFCKTIKYIKNNFKAYLVNFYPDNPFVFWNNNSNEQVLKSLPNYDCFLIWSQELISLLYMAGCKKVDYFPFGFDQNLFEQEINITGQDLQKYKCDVCFIGTWEKEREEWLTNLLLKIPDLDLKIWGNLWQENLPKNSILINKIQKIAIYGAQAIKAFRLSKINLNFIRKQNLNSHNMRTFEVPASKSFLLTQRTQEQANLLFKENLNIECFSEIDELEKKIKYYLTHENLRQDIIKKSYTQAQKFNLKNLLKNFLIENF